MASAERELGAFMRAVSEMFGAEHFNPDSQEEGMSNGRTTKT